jgi:hypothetical protein
LRKGLLKSVFDFRRVRADAVRGPHVEIQYPKGTAGTRFDFIRPSAQDAQTHMFQQRQDIGQSHELVAAEHFKMQQPVVLFREPIEIHREGFVSADLFQMSNVRDRDARRVIVAIGGRKRLAITVKQSGALFLAVFGMELHPELVLPREHDLCQAFPQVCEVVFGNSFGMGADDEVHARQRRIRYLDAEFRALAVHGLHQDILYAPPQLGVIAFARNIDQGRDEASECILA